MRSQCSFTARVNSACSRIFASFQLRSLRFEKAFFGWALLLLAAPAVAGDMNDPMRPPSSGGGGTTHNAADPRWTVTGILISPERRLAMINDRLIGIGEKVDGASVRN